MCEKIMYKKPMNALLKFVISKFLLISLTFLFISQNVFSASPDAILVSEAPTDQGLIFSPGVRALPNSYIEEEFMLSGSGSVFSYLNNPPLSPTDLVVAEESVPYTTRAIVRRPVQSWKFNGAVVVEWWNSTAGFDTAPVWDASAEYFTRKGYIYVGVTNSTTSIDFLKTGCRVLGVAPPSCGTRYANLSLPENGLAYDMLNQISHLLKNNSDTTPNPIPQAYHIKRLYHAGESQQGGSVITYASAFHSPVNDGYFIQSAARARPINFDTPCNSPLARPFPNCTPRLEGQDALVRTDLPVPVVQALAETDIAGLFGTTARQADTAFYRYYEMAGVAHLTVHKDIIFLPEDILGPLPIFVEDLCEFPMNTLADGPVFGSYLFNAMWDNLEKQVRYGVAPPAGDLLDTQNGLIQRDTFGNALGGIRLPTMDVPVASYIPTNQIDSSLPPILQGPATLACRLAGQVIPFEQDVLEQLYPNRNDFKKPFVLKTFKLLHKGFLLPKDALTMLSDNLNR